MRPRLHPKPEAADFPERGSEATRAEAFCDIKPVTPLGMPWRPHPARPPS